MCGTEQRVGAGCVARQVETRQQLVASGPSGRTNDVKVCRYLLPDFNFMVCCGDETVAKLGKNKSSTQEFILRIAGVYPSG